MRIRIFGAVTFAAPRVSGAATGARAIAGAAACHTWRGGREQKAGTGTQRSSQRRTGIGLRYAQPPSQAGASSPPASVQQTLTASAAGVVYVTDVKSSPRVLTCRVWFSHSHLSRISREAYVRPLWPDVAVDVGELGVEGMGDVFRAA